MKKLTLAILVAGILAVGASAYEAGDKFSCAIYKDYNFNTDLSYEYTTQEMKNSKFSFHFKNKRTIVSKPDTYKYFATNKKGWDIYKQVDGDIIFSISDGVNKTTGFVTTGIMTSAKSDIINYAVCEKIK